MESLPSVVLESTLEFQPLGSKRLLLGAPGGSPAPDRVAVTSNVRPGTAMKAVSGLAPIGSSTTTCRLKPDASAPALLDWLHFSLSAVRMFGFPFTAGG